MTPWRSLSSATASRTGSFRRVGAVDRLAEGELVEHQPVLRVEPAAVRRCGRPRPSTACRARCRSPRTCRNRATAAPVDVAGAAWMSSAGGLASGCSRPDTDRSPVRATLPASVSVAISREPLRQARAGRAARRGRRCSSGRWAVLEVDARAAQPGRADVEVDRQLGRCGRCRGRSRRRRDGDRPLAGVAQVESALRRDHQPCEQAVERGLAFTFRARAGCSATSSPCSESVCQLSSSSAPSSPFRCCLLLPLPAPRCRVCEPQVGEPAVAAQPELQAGGGLAQRQLAVPAQPRAHQLDAGHRRRVGRAGAAAAPAASAAPTPPAAPGRAGRGRRSPARSGRRGGAALAAQVGGELPAQRRGQPVAAPLQVPHAELQPLDLERDIVLGLQVAPAQAAVLELQRTEPQRPARRRRLDGGRRLRGADVDAAGRGQPVGRFRRPCASRSSRVRGCCSRSRPISAWRAFRSILPASISRRSSVASGGVAAGASGVLSFSAVSSPRSSAMFSAGASPACQRSARACAASRPSSRGFSTGRR